MARSCDATGCLLMLHMRLMRVAPYLSVTRPVTRSEKTLPFCSGSGQESFVSTASVAIHRSSCVGSGENLKLESDAAATVAAMMEPCRLHVYSVRLSIFL